MNYRHNKIPVAICGIVMLLGLLSCANIGTPSGGAVDEYPPRFVSASPNPGATNVSKTKLTLNFDELINVKDAFSKVVVSPTSKSTPKVSSLGRRITVDFDSLQPNTTYTIDFADAIEDVNEGNILQGFTYTFSTGENLDTLRISGRVLAARNLEPQQSMLVGVTPNLSDSTFKTLRLLRVAKTDDRGRFTIRGLAPGNYRVFALADKDNDYKYSSPEEDIAFYDFTISPYTRQGIARDTIFDPLGRVDSVLDRNRTIYLPNDILLRSFNSEIRQQYLSKYERIDSTRIFFKFNTRNDSLPRLRLIGDELRTSLGTLEASQKLDSLVYWLSPELMRRDSLFIETTYTRTDQNLIPELVTDTLKFITNRPKPVKHKKNERRLSATDSLALITTNFKLLAAGTQDVNLPLLFESATPLVSFDTTMVRILQKTDSIYRPAAKRPVIIRPDSLSPRHFALQYPWEYGGSYRLEIDSLAATDIYGHTSLPLTQEFTIKKMEEYCSLQFNISGLPAGTSAFVELLNGSDAVQRTEPVVNNTAIFLFLQPGKYYARIILDDNGNGEYDTGNYELLRQPELAYYYPKVINIKKNWDKEENWALFDTPVDMMKPLAVTKNKPKAQKQAKGKNAKRQAETDEEDEDYFDPTANPFDPNQKTRRRTNSY